MCSLYKYYKHVATMVVLYPSGTVAMPNVVYGAHYNNVTQDIINTSRLLIKVVIIDVIWFYPSILSSCCKLVDSYRPYIANRWRWKSFMVFVDWLITTKLFQWNSLCNRYWPCKTTVQPQNFYNKLHSSSATSKLFHLKCFAVYGIS